MSEEQKPFLSINTANTHNYTISDFEFSELNFSIESYGNSVVIITAACRNNHMYVLEEFSLIKLPNDKEHLVDLAIQMPFDYNTIEKAYDSLPSRFRCVGVLKKILTLSLSLRLSIPEVKSMLKINFLS